MAWFDRFTRRWAATGVLAEPSDVQADAGFAFLGANTPTVELFNALFSYSDSKDRWLFDQVHGVALAGGITLTADGGEEQLLNPIRALLTASPGRQIGPVRSWTTPGTFTYTKSSASVKAIKIEMIAGGGGGGGAAACGAGQGAAAGGASSGATLEAYLTSGFDGQTMVIGQGASGGSASANGGVGGNTTFGGTMLRCIGGPGGIGSPALGGMGVLSPNGGAGVSGTVPILRSAQGHTGAPGYVLNAMTVQGGAGGHTHWGSSGYSNAAVGLAAVGHGAGGGGASAVQNSGPFTGGAGAPGRIDITEYS